MRAGCGTDSLWSASLKPLWSTRTGLTFLKFLRRHYNYGKGAYRFRVQLASTEGGAVKLEPPAFYWRLLRSPFRKGLGFRAALMALLVLISQLASALGFLSEWRSSMAESKKPGTPQMSEGHRP